jgi:hypothetical protein
MYRYALRPSCVDFLNDAFRQHISTGSRRTPLKCADQFLGNEAKGRAGRIYPLNYARRDISIEGAGEGVAGDATRGSGQARYGWVFPAQFAADQFLSPRALARHRRDLYKEDWGLSVQQLLSKEFTFQAGYLATHGVRLFARNFINQCEQFDSTLNCTQPFANFGEIDIKRDAGTSHFDALQLSLQKKFAQGWMLNTQYMWSNSRNDGSVGGGEANAPENKNCLRCDYGPSVFDVRHNLVISSIYELPFGPGKRFLQFDGAIGQVLGGWSFSGLGRVSHGSPSDRHDWLGSYTSTVRQLQS